MLRTIGKSIAQFFCEKIKDHELFVVKNRLRAGGDPIYVQHRINVYNVCRADLLTFG